MMGSFFTLNSLSRLLHYLASVSAYSLISFINCSTTLLSQDVEMKEEKGEHVHSIIWKYFYSCMYYEIVLYRIGICFKIQLI